MNHRCVYPDATARIIGGPESPGLSGQVRFFQKKHCVLVVADITGLPSSETGFFALHIHSGESCTGIGFPCSGSHFNPKNTDHPLHAGDLPPLLRCNGGAHLAVATDRFRVHEIIGRTVVIHSAPDDFISQPAGNAGKKIACGVIRRN